MRHRAATKGTICDVSVIASPLFRPIELLQSEGTTMMNSSGTVIGKGICIRGEVSGEEDFFLDGVLEGNITLTGKRLTVGANGVIHADIVAGDLVVFGRVEGSVKASGRAELKHSAVFVGDISAARLSIEDNATLQGYVDLTEAAQPAKKEPVAQRKLPSQRKPQSTSSSTAKQSSRSTYQHSPLLDRPRLCPARMGRHVCPTKGPEGVFRPTG